jgi:hypothetical protein
LLPFCSFLPSIQWKSIRKIHVSSEFGVHLLPGDYVWPSEECYENWPRLCEKLKEIPQLKSLVLDIKVRNVTSRRLNYSHMQHYILKHTLKPLKTAKAKTFEIETNVEPSQEINDILGDVNFVMVYKERPDNIEVYGERPKLILPSQPSTKKYAHTSW